MFSAAADSARAPELEPGREPGFAKCARFSAAWGRRAARAGSWLVLAIAAASCGAPEFDGPRNLLLVVLDTTRADYLGCYGAARPTSPTIDTLAQRGTRFANAYSQSSLTPVSAASFLTGSWPFRTGIRSLFVVSEDMLSDDVTSIFQHLREAGRDTAAFVSARPMGAHYGLDRGFELYEDEIADVPAAGTMRRAVQRRAEETTDLALDWLSAHAAEPFACMVHFFDAHDVALLPPAEFLAQHVSFPLPAGLGREPTVEQVRELYATPERRRELYDAEIRYMDGQVARLLAELERRGVLDDTVVCVIADHGESLGEHDFWDHGLLWEEQLRVPFVLAGPGVPAGVAVEPRVRLVDLAPTIEELFGLTASSARPRDGSSALELARGVRESGERLQYAEVRHAPNDRLQRPAALHSVLLANWKVVTEPGGVGLRLYDLSDDAGEIRDRAATEAERAVRHTALLEAWGAYSDGAASLEGLPAERLEDLRKLGYLGDE